MLKQKRLQITEVFEDFLTFFFSEWMLWMLFLVLMPYVGAVILPLVHSFRRRFGYYLVVEFWFIKSISPQLSIRQGFRHHLHWRLLTLAASHCVFTKAFSLLLYILLFEKTAAQITFPIRYEANLVSFTFPNNIEFVNRGDKSNIILEYYPVSMLVPCDNTSVKKPLILNHFSVFDHFNQTSRRSNRHPHNVFG